MQDKIDLNVCVIDYGMGNLRSVYNRVAETCTRPLLSSRPEDVLAADKLVLPGVGHFAQGMRNLESSGLREALEEKVIEQSTPILGICLGMQLFTQFSEEGHVDGLGWINAKTVKFDSSTVENPYFKVPHMGWNTLNVKSDHSIYRGITADCELYFCHSYFVQSHEPSELASTCNYGLEFCASVHRGNIHGMQFHPEKSHSEGARLIENFIKLGVAEIV